MSQSPGATDGDAGFDLQVVRDRPRIAFPKLKETMADAVGYKISLNQKEIML